MTVIFAPQATPVTSDAGLQRLAGTTAIAGTPDIPAPARAVQLLRRRRDTTLVSETISDASGAWAFDGIQGREPGDGYTVIAYDHTGTHDPVAKANLIPSPMPPDPAEHP
jgi:hypothetical protein